MLLRQPQKFEEIDPKTLDVGCALRTSKRRLKKSLHVSDPCVFFKEEAATGLTAFTDSLELYEEKDLKAHIRKIFKVTEEESLESTTGRAPY